MKNIILLSFLILTSGLSAQSQPVLPVGYPDHSPSLDVLPGFINPPPGYGNVPFYWWVGDPLTRERLLWQLDQLKDKGISSLQINYCHSDQGGISYGLSMPSQPALFSEDWWDLVKWFLGETQKRRMSISLSDYTLGLGQGFSMDKALKEYPELNGSLLKSLSKELQGEGTWILPVGLLSLTAFQMENGKVVFSSRKDLSAQIKDGILTYYFGDRVGKVLAVYREKIIPSFDPMHPLSGKIYNRFFFEKFEERFPGQGGKGLNFFFSDELEFRLKGWLWNDYFTAEFKKRKGYDIVSYLDALFMNIGDISSKIKLDYNDVMVSLSEENFFRPVYQWHAERGMIFGCDHGGRGKDVTEFGDYFRTQRWNQGPGSDQPRLGKDIIKAKVAASIAHLYQRPRVWLEGFYGSGWGTTTAQVADAIFSNFPAGYNLLSLHGLYYTTHGGWWEWAPPCNHFHMPYWPHIGPLMQCVERLSYLLSQGFHQCDVAILYPVEPQVADLDGKTSISEAFAAGNALYRQGIDFDFIDYESLARSDIGRAGLSISGETYRVLVVPSMKAIRYTSLKKIEAFKKSGGIIVNIGALPEATEKHGANDQKVSQMVAQIFRANKNTLLCRGGEMVPQTIANLYTPHFQVLSPLREVPYVMHRLAGKRQIFALYNVPKGTKCFFQARGPVELWNPWTGKVESLATYTNVTPRGTEVVMPLSDKEIQLVVFPGENLAQKNLTYVARFDRHSMQTQRLEGDWEFELNPSLDNRWGDFEFPAATEMLGAQVRRLYFTEHQEYQGDRRIDFNQDWRTVTCGFGPQFQKLGPLTQLPSELELLKLNPQRLGEEFILAGKVYRWEEYCFSWQQGVEGDYGHQGYHGLKGEMYDNFIRLGALGQEKHSLKRIPEPAGNFYILSTMVTAPYNGTFHLLTGETKPYLLYINSAKIADFSPSVPLHQGGNRVLAVYDRACETYLAFRQPVARQLIRQPISMRWYNDTAVLPFDCCTYPNTRSALFAFDSAPGMQSFSFAAYGKVSLWIDGISTEVRVVQKQANGLSTYQADCRTAQPRSSQVVMKIDDLSGHRGGAALPRYIRQNCGKGLIALGDWSKIQGLQAYSGGAWYRKTILLSEEDTRKEIVLDLGNVVSTAQVLVNSHNAGILVTAPWKLDISRFVVPGENRIEVLIYNTLGNHYITIPTRYPGSTVSGLLGPVFLHLHNNP